tara:strand:+ start:604 stop:837 length:234 start_codon:yes stop_codon:yes gene_type:complete
MYSDIYNFINKTTNTAMDIRTLYLLFGIILFTIMVLLTFKVSQYEFEIERLNYIENIENDYIINDYTDIVNPNEDQI